MFFARLDCAVPQLYPICDRQQLIHRHILQHSSAGPRGGCRRDIEEAGGTTIDFNPIVVTDGIAMGTRGVRASLIRREVIADLAELAIRGHSLDGVLFLVGHADLKAGRALHAARDGCRVRHAAPLPGVLMEGGFIADTPTRTAR